MHINGIDIDAAVESIKLAIDDENAKALYEHALAEINYIITQREQARY